MGPCQAWLDGGHAGMARHASRAVPLRATGLAFGPGMALWAVFHAVLVREARPKLWARLVTLAFTESNKINVEISNTFTVSYFHFIHRIIQI